MTYTAIYEAWSADPEGFWLTAASLADWSVAPTRALDATRAPFYAWYPDARLNTCWNAVDRHVAAGHGARDAILYDSPLTGTKARISYAQLQARVARLAGALAARGIAAGDRVVIYMPMVPEALVAMLACARLGAVHSVVFGGFAAPELAVRIDDCTPKAVIAASCGIEPARIVPYKPLLDAAIDLSRHKPAFCVILQREQLPADLVPGRDHDWTAFQDDAEDAPCTDVAATDPAYILYTSGTTGVPKGVVRAVGGHVVALSWTMQAIYGIAPGDVFWAASDVGWVVGHSYICYGPLFAGATTVLYEGKPVGTPDCAAFWRVIGEYGVKAFFTAPTAIRAVKREDPDGRIAQGIARPTLRALFLAGERADPDTVSWAERHLGVPVIDHWWQTETGYAIAANPLGLGLLPPRSGSPGLPMPGYDIAILNEEGAPVPPGTLGAIALRLPLPPGTLPTLWNAEERFRKSYLSRFPGHYETGDAGLLDEDGYLFVMARTDDVINVAGHRLSTGAMEEVLASHPDVAECAVIGVADSLKGQSPFGFLCLNKGCRRSEAAVVAECIGLVRDRIGPVADFKRAAVVERLPKTRSGKILRGTMAKIADGKPWTMPATIDDPAVLDLISAALRRFGLADGGAGTAGQGQPLPAR
jgi:propionyl-CoA synthetase